MAKSAPRPWASRENLAEIVFRQGNGARTSIMHCGQTSGGRGGGLRTQGEERPPPICSVGASCTLVVVPACLLPQGGALPEG